MKFTPDQLAQARRVDLVEFLKARGYELKNAGKGNYRVVGHGGLIVQGSRWKQFSSDTGGNSIEFCTDILGMKFKEAVEELLIGQSVSIENFKPLPNLNTKKEFKLPKRNRNERRVIAYLTKQRKLPQGVVISLIRAGLLWQDDRGNCVFPCRDATGEVHGAILNGTLSDIRWKGFAPGTNTEYPWWWPPEQGGGDSDLVTVTESPIDTISLCVLRPGARQGHMIAMGGLHFEALIGFIERVKVKHIVFALDRDILTQPKLIKTMDKLNQLKFEFLHTGYKVSFLWPPETYKDWNEIISLGGVNNVNA